MTIENPSPLKRAQWCLSNGIIPLPLDGKRPTIADWPNFRPTEASLADYFPSTQQDVGGLLGPASQDLVDVDLDWTEAEVLGASLLPESWQFGRRDETGVLHLRHVLVRCPEIASTDWKAPSTTFSPPLSVVQVLAQRRQVVLPGSIHEGTGQEIEWLEPPTPDSLVVMEATVLLEQVNRLAGTALLVRLWPELEGSRHEVALALAGACHHAGWSMEETTNMATALLTVAHDREKEDRVKAVLATLQRAADSEPVTGFPKLAELLPSDVVSCLHKWWGLGEAPLQLTFKGKPLDSVAPATDSKTAPPWQQDIVSVVRGHERKPQPIDWLWKGWLAKGKLHIVAGPPGTGKTSLALSLLATVTRGSTWPDGSLAAQGHVLIWSGEDDIEDTLIPRLIACGADLHRVHFVDKVRGNGSSRPFDPARDAQLLHDYASKLNPIPALLLVDPIVSAVAGDSHKNAEVRRGLQPLVDLAQDLRCALLGVTHFSKGGAGRDPIERVTGSLAFGALARVVLAAAKLSDEEGGGRVLVRAKSNIGADSGGFMYDLLPMELADHPQVITTVVAWGLAMEGSARELLAKAEAGNEDLEEATKLRAAMDYLLSELKDGPKPAKQLISEGVIAAGCGERTLKSAKAKLNIESVKDKFGWYWKLPSE